MNSRNLSPGYQQQSRLLFERYQRKELSIQEYDDQKKLLFDQEVQPTAQNQTVQVRLAIQEFETEQLNTWEHRQREQEEKRIHTEEKEQQRLFNQAESERLRLETEKLAQEKQVYAAKAELLRQENEQRLTEAKIKMNQEKLNDKYVNQEIPTILNEMRNSAKFNRCWSSFCQLVIIIVSTIVAGIVNIPEVPRLAISIMTIIVAIVNGIVWIFKFKERSINSQQTADMIEYERNLYRLGIKDYADKAKDPLKAGQLLAERIEDLKNEQNKRQQLLEQTSGKPPETVEAPKAV
jgi:hypothetical protein